MWLNNALFVLWVFERGTLIKDVTLLYLTVLVVVLHITSIHDVLYSNTVCLYSTYRSVLVYCTTIV